MQFELVFVVAAICSLLAQMWLIAILKRQHPHERVLGKADIKLRPD